MKNASLGHGHDHDHPLRDDPELQAVAAAVAAGIADYAPLVAHQEVVGSSGPQRRDTA